MFMHIPKTGGHTLRAILTEVYGDAVCPAQNWDELVKVDVSRYKVFIGHFGRQVETLLGSDVQYAVFLRNPDERLYSLYKYLKKTNQIDAEASFLTYLTKIAPGRGEHNQMTRYLATTPDGAFNPSEVETFVSSAIICNFDNLGESTEGLAKHLSWSGVPSIPHLNAQDDEDISDIQMDAETYKALMSANELDKRLWLWVLNGME